MLVALGLSGCSLVFSGQDTPGVPADGAQAADAGTGDAAPPNDAFGPCGPDKRVAFLSSIDQSQPVAHFPIGNSGGVSPQPILNDREGGPAANLVPMAFLEQDIFGEKTALRFAGGTQSGRLEIPKEVHTEHFSTTPGIQFEGSTFSIEMLLSIPEDPAALGRTDLFTRASTDGESQGQRIYLVLNGVQKDGERGKASVLRERLAQGPKGNGPGIDSVGVNILEVARDDASPTDERVWHHMVYRHLSDHTASFIVDGVTVANLINTKEVSPVEEATPHFGFGSFIPIDGALPKSIAIDEIAFYNRILGDEEVGKRFELISPCVHVEQ